MKDIIDTTVVQPAKDAVRRLFRNGSQTQKVFGGSAAPDQTRRS
jgi:hypothetical protein